MVAANVGDEAEAPCLPQVGLAWSVHVAIDDTRRALVPTARHDAGALRDAFADALARAERRRHGDGLLVELTLIDGVNDRAADAAALVRLLAPLPGRTKVNLLPYNPTATTPSFRPEPAASVKAFQSAVRDGGLLCTVRAARGDGDAAACGQLAAQDGARDNPTP